MNEREQDDAMGDTSICLVRCADLTSIFLKYPAIALKVLAEYSRRLEQSEKQTPRLSTEKVETRLALFLVDCLDSNPNSHEIVLPMSKKGSGFLSGHHP